MRRNLDDWERAGDFATSYTLAQIKQFSPKSRALLEIQSRRDLEILEKIYANSRAARRRWLRTDGAFAIVSPSST